MAAPSGKWARSLGAKIGGGGFASKDRQALVVHARVNAKDMARSTPPPGLVALGVTRPDEDVTAVRGWLQKHDYRVQEFPSLVADTVPLEYPASTTAAIFVVSSEVESDELPYDQRLRVTYSLGVVAGQIGAERTIVLVEQGLATLVDSVGVQVVRYRPSQVEACLSAVDTFLRRCREGQVHDPDGWPLGGGIPEPDQQRPGENVMAATLAVAAVAMMILIAFVQPWATWGMSEPNAATMVGGDAASVAVEGLAEHGRGLAQGESARCVIDLRELQGHSGVVECENGGYVVLRGYRGPWSQIADLEAGSGVIAEARGAETGKTYSLSELTPARLAEINQTGGLGRMVVQFSTTGQTLLVRTTAELGGNETLLEFHAGA